MVHDFKLRLVLVEDGGRVPGSVAPPRHADRGGGPAAAQVRWVDLDRGALVSRGAVPSAVRPRRFPWGGLPTSLGARPSWGGNRRIDGRGIVGGG